MTSSPHPDAPIILVRDLIFLSKINAAAETAGIAVKVVRDPAQLSTEAGQRLIVDLNLAGAIESAGAWLAAAAGRSAVGFVSHVDSEAISQAQRAGIRRILPRSRFVQMIPEHLQGEPSDESASAAG